MTPIEVLARDGVVVLPPSAGMIAWAERARALSLEGLAGLEADQWRHGNTWCVGLDLLPNAADGSLPGGVNFSSEGMKIALQSTDLEEAALHLAQVSLVRPGYPKQDPSESDTAHRFRKNRDAAHLDGLRPVGPDMQRQIADPHAFVLGIALTPVTVETSPLVVWKGSHRVMANALRAALKDVDPADWGRTNITAPYQAARKEVFETCERIEITADVGAEILMHRHAIHGIAPWRADEGQDRLVAYFRPEPFGVVDWLLKD